MQTFACEEIPRTSGEYFLRAQLTLACDHTSARRRAWRNFAVAMVLVYPVGFPLVLICLLLPHRARMRELVHHSYHYGIRLKLSAYTFF